MLSAQDTFPGESAIREALARDRNIGDYTTDIRISDDLELKSFFIARGVLREVYTGPIMAREMAQRWATLFDDAITWDIGCGSGILGITAAHLCARTVVMSDITQSATTCSQINVDRYRLRDKCAVIRSDLFAHPHFRGRRAHVIVSNMPFAHGEPDDKDDLSRAFLGGTGMVATMIQWSTEHLVRGGYLIMPFRTEAGPQNDPSILGPQCGYEIADEAIITDAGGIQFGGPLRIYCMQLR